MKHLIIVLFLSYCSNASAQDLIQKEFFNSCSMVISLNNSVHGNAVSLIIKNYGLSSTGKIYFCGIIKPSNKIKNFCEEGEEVKEYRTSHLNNQTLNIIWYNPKNKKTLLIYPLANGEALSS